MFAASAHQARFFDRNGEYVAVREFAYGDRVYAAGEVFPWRDLGLHVNQLHALWLSVLVNVKPVETPAPVVEAPPKSKSKRAG